MKKIFVCLLFVSFMLTVNGQQVYLETGMVISSFVYKNSSGNSLDNLKGTYRNSLGLGVRMPVMKSAWHISLEASNNKYGATTSDQILGNYSEWDVSYLGVNLGVDYEFFKPPMINIDRQGFSFYLKGVFATEFLINGKQKLNSQVFDLSGEEEFDKPVFFLKGGIGFNYYITRTYVAFAQYMFGRSLLFGNYSGQEKLNYVTHCFTLGFSIDLFYNRK
jgi:hypothetical protein